MYYGSHSTSTAASSSYTRSKESSWYTGRAAAAPSSSRLDVHNAPRMATRRAADAYEAAAATPRGFAAAGGYAARASEVSRTPRSYAAAPAAAPAAAAPSGFMTQVSQNARPRTAVKRRSGALPQVIPRLPAARTTKMLLVLDLDETLVHASVDPVAHDVAFDVAMETQSVKVYVKIRPGAFEFLRRMASMFEVAVFTASLSQYADQVVDYLDPENRFVTHRLYREHCTNVDGSYVKDLELMGRPMHTVCIVDNSPVAYSFHPDNAVSIISWFDDNRDVELTRVTRVLHEFARCGDVYMIPKN